MSSRDVSQDCSLVCFGVDQSAAHRECGADVVRICLHDYGSGPGSMGAVVHSTPASARPCLKSGANWRHCNKAGPAPERVHYLVDRRG